MIRYKVLIHSFSWQSISIFIQAICQLVVMGVLARYLTAEQFGIVAAANVIVTLVQMFTDSGVSAALVQRAAIDKYIIAAAAQISFLIGVIFYFIIIFNSSLVEEFYSIIGLSKIINTLAITFILIAAFKIPESLLQRELKFDLLMKINLISSVFGYMIPAIILAANGYGAWSLVYPIIMQMVIKVFLLFLLCPVKIYLIAKRKTYIEILRYGLGLTSIKFWNFIYRQGDRMVLGKTIGVAGLGQYHLANQLSYLPGKYLGDIFDSVLFPVMSKIRDDKEKISLLVTYSYQLVLYAITAMGIFLAVFGSEIINLIYGEKWNSIIIVFQVLCLGAGIRSATRVADVTNRAFGRFKAASIGKFFSAMLLLVVVYLASPHGLNIIAVSILLCNIIALIIITLIAFSNIEVSKTDIYVATVKFLICIGLIAIVLSVIHKLFFEIDNVLIKIIAAIFLWLFFMLLVGYLGYKREIKILMYQVFN